LLQVRGKNSSRSRNFIWSQEKLAFLKKRKGKQKSFNMADLIPLKAGRNIWGDCDLNDIFLTMKKENLLKTYPS